MFSFVIILVLRSKKDKYKDCCELHWIWLTVWFGLNLNLSRLKLPCHLFPAPHTNEILTQFRNCARFEDKYKSCLSAPSPASQPRQPTRKLPSLASLTLLSCAFNVVKTHFEGREDPAGTGCSGKGVELPAFKGAREGGAAALLAQQSQSDEGKGRQGWQQWGSGPLGFQYTLGYRRLWVHIPWNTHVHPGSLIPSWEHGCARLFYQKGWHMWTIKICTWFKAGGVKLNTSNSIYYKLLWFFLFEWPSQNFPFMNSVAVWLFLKWNNIG